MVWLPFARNEFDHVSTKGWNHGISCTKSLSPHVLTCYGASSTRALRNDSRVRVHESLFSQILFFSSHLFIAWRSSISVIVYRGSGTWSRIEHLKLESGRTAPRLVGQLHPSDVEHDFPTMELTNVSRKDLHETMDFAEKTYVGVLLQIFPSTHRTSPVASWLITPH